MNQDQAEELLDYLKQETYLLVSLFTFFGEWRNYIQENPKSAEDRVGGPIVSIFQHSVLTSALMTAYRIWETGADCRSISALRRDFPETALSEALRGDEFEVQRRSAILEFYSCVDSYVDTDRHLAIGVSRAEGFAHSVEQARLRRRMIEPRVASLEELELSLELAKKALNHADFALRSNQTAFEFLHEDYERIYRRGFPRLFPLR